MSESSVTTTMRCPVSRARELHSVPDSGDVAADEEEAEVEGEGEAEVSSHVFWC